MEKEIISGNYFDKYNTKNPVYRRIMKSFFNSILEFIATDNEESIQILEAGCGEGHLASIIMNTSKNILYSGFDIDEKIIEEGKVNNTSGDFRVGSIYNVQEYLTTKYNYVIVSEVLEHIEHPTKAIQQLLLLDSDYFIFSVPREPIWRLLNILRLKYTSKLGNTPGHIQHWSKKKFLNLIESHFQIIQVKSPLPWTMVLCKKKE